MMGEAGISTKLNIILLLRHVIEPFQADPLLDPMEDFIWIQHFKTRYSQNNVL